MDIRLQRFLKQNQKAFDGLEGNLLGASSGKAPRTILMTSAHPREGKSLASMGWACSLSSLSRNRVLLVDGNLRDPAGFSVLGRPGEAGLTELLAEEPSSAALACVQETELTGLSFVPCGNARSSGLSRTECDRLSQHLSRWSSEFDYVIFDGAALLAASDTALMASLFDAVVLVVSFGRTTWEALAQAQTRLHRLGATAIGAVVNRKPRHIPEGLYESY